MAMGQNFKNSFQLRLFVTEKERLNEKNEEILLFCVPKNKKPLENSFNKLLIFKIWINS
jgi:hypothetical protein